MHFNIKARQFDLTDALREHVRSQFANLPRLPSTSHVIHVTLDKTPNHGFKADTQLNYFGKRLVAHAQHEDMYTAINSAADKLSRQIEKELGKIQSHQAVPAKHLVAADSELSEELLAGSYA